MDASPAAALALSFFAEAVASSIVDAQQPGAHWERDRSLPYSSADDYALVARSATLPRMAGCLRWPVWDVMEPRPQHSL